VHDRLRVRDTEQGELQAFHVECGAEEDQEEDRQAIADASFRSNESEVGVAIS
jgi:hypothetical protein